MPPISIWVGPFFSRSFNSRASSWKAECSPGLSAGAGSLVCGGGSSAGGGAAGSVGGAGRNGSTLAGSSGVGGGVRLRALMLEGGEAVRVAANAETAKTGKAAVAVEHRQARHFDRQAFAAFVDRPVQHDAAPGVLGGERARDFVLGIELEGGGDLAPGPVEQGGGARPEQPGESLDASGEAVAASISQTKRQGGRRVGAGGVAATGVTEGDGICGSMAAPRPARPPR